MSALRPLAGAWPYAFVILGPLLLFAPFLLGLQVMYWGTPLLQFYPWRSFALETLRAGHLPLWNPFLGNGAPLIANYQSAVFYPPNWLYLLLPADDAMGWLAAFHLAWAGAGMVSLGRALGLRPLGQAVAGLAFGLSQYLVARAGFLSINAAAAWLPWLVLLAGRVVGAGDSRARLKSGLLLTACLAFQLLAGHAQTAWYSLLLAGAWVLWRVAAGGPALRRPRTLAARAGLLALFGAAAFLLAAIQLVPTAELLRESPRAEAADYDFVMTYSFSPWRLLTLIAPDMLGNPARGEYFGYGNYWEDAVYVGLIPLLLGLGMIVRAARDWLRRRSRRAPDPSEGARVDGETPHLVLFLTAALVVSAVLALGRNTPVFPFFYRWVPTFDLFQAPARMMLWFVFALALLAGLGADRWQTPPGRGLYWTRLGAAGALAVLLTSLAAQAALPETGPLAQHVQTIARALALAGVGLFAAALLSLLRPAGGTHPGWSAAVAAFVLVDLVYAGWGLNPGAPPDLYRTATSSAGQIAPALAGGQRLFYYPDDDYHVKFDRLLSFERFGPAEWALAMREAQTPNTAMIDGLASANNFEPLVSARYAGVVEVISATRSVSLLQMMNVGVVATRASLSWELLAEEPVSGARFYRVPGEVRRWWVVNEAVSVADEPAARQAVAAPDFDPSRTVILEADDPGAPASAEGPRILTPSPNAVTIAVSVDRPGWLVLADTYYPGWAAYVDGRPAALLRANYAFRAVALEQGDHRVDFRYEPASFRVGSWLSALGGVIWLGLAGTWLAVRRRR